MIRRSIGVAVLGAFIAPALAFAFGGWAVITLDKLPEYIVAGTPVTISFAVRQHGMTLLGGLHPFVSARSGTTVVDATMSARPDSHYVATLTLPRDGVWVIDIRSGFMNTTMTTPLMPMRVVAADAPAPAPMADALRGKHLFVAKGCVTCHVHPETPEWQSINVGPNLTGRRYVPEVLAAFLDDPEKSSLSKASGNATTASFVRMPRLGLDSREITSLVAFVNGGSAVAARSVPRR